MKIIKAVAIGIGLLATIGTAHTAHADSVSGFVCGLTFTPANPIGMSLGQYGDVHIWVGTEATCATGPWKGVQFCSTGGINTSCDPTWLYSELGITSFYQVMMHALENKTRVNVNFTPAPGAPPSTPGRGQFVGITSK
jgi:hypothetical protein